PSYHKLDVNRVAPNTENGVYTFYSADTLILTMTHTDVLCHGGSDGTATVTVTNGTSPYTYKWSPSGGNAATATGLSAGTYKVIVTDANNCNGQQTVIIAEPAELKLSISGGGFIPYCIQDGPPTITLSANASGGTPPYIYSWPGGSRSVSSSGFYSCAVIDDNGCIESATVFVWFIPIVCSRDPNDIAGPIGYEPGQWVSINDQLPYTIRFENDPDFATAPAQVVTVTCPFDDNLNPFSLRLGDFGFANYIFNVPANSIFYSQRLDVVDSLGVYVDVLAGIDVNNNEAFWIFESIDPTTGLPPTDAMTGFLPVNDSIFHRGEGFVSYTVAPKSTSVTGDSIFATAEIVFDINESILTNTWENIIDAVPPTSTMDTLPTYTSSQLIPLSWSAIDDPGGVGVGYYDLMYSKDGGAIQVQVTGLDTSYYEFPANNNSSYDFYVIAIDRVGNREPNKTVPDVSIVVGAPTLAITQPTQTDVYCVGDVMTILWEVTGIGLINIDISNDAGASYTPMLTQFDASVGEYTYPIPQSFVASDTCLLRLYSDGMTHVTNSDLFRIKALPVVDLGAASTYGLGDQVVLDAGAGYSAYTWNNSEITQQISFMGYEAGLGSHIFSVSVTDIYSCAGSGSVTILIEGSDTCTQSINLPVNWSMFSGYVYPFTPNMIDVTSAITSDIIMIKDKKGDVYWPYFLLNNIGDMLVGDGYQAKLFNAATLVLEGECVVPELTPLSLDVGWSLIGYLRQTPASVITMFSPISSSTIMVKNSQGHVYWVYFGIDQIGNMNPGEGYQVKMSASDVLTYPANSANISKKTVINLRSEYFGEILNTGNNMTLGIPLSAWENIPDKGDEIAVFTHSGLLVGSGVFEEGNLAICIWGNDKLSDYQDGIADNEKFTVKLWNKKEGSLSKIEVTQWIEGDNSYSPNRISIMGKLTLSEKNSQDEVVIHQNKPNPFKGKTEISFYLPEKMQVELSVYDAIGEKLIELIPESDMSGGLHKYEFDARNLATGTYFYKLTTPDKTYTKALNLIN
ncbi:MAG: T9SS type A sorting domain-containing protein, partial [Bacteroidota bacterium]|nr:T9SS type A sorting domain-containing protein [Bacteroidota bacterium]